MKRHSQTAVFGVNESGTFTNTLFVVDDAVEATEEFTTYMPFTFGYVSI